MAMSIAEIRLKQNPILTGLLLGLGQGAFVAEKLFPRLPQALRGMTLVKMSNEMMKKYNLRRAPGGATKRINIQFNGEVFTVDQHSVDIPMPRELLQEADESRRLNVGSYIDVGRMAMSTATQVLALGYEIEAATLAIDSNTYASGHVVALSGGTKWSAPTGTPVTDIRAAAEVIRKKTGKRPNLLTLSADAFFAITTNAEVKGYLPSTNTGPASLEQLKTILNVAEIVIGDAVWMNDSNVGQDVWGNNAILAYVPKIGGSGSDISLAEPGFGFTSVLDGNPFAETPYFDNELKSWVYGATYERRVNIAYNDAAFLFTNPK
ncbi:MAG: hypothetical protein WC091_01205 [Sulfuricellaceae bacterium]